MFDFSVFIVEAILQEDTAMAQLGFPLRNCSVGINLPKAWALVLDPFSPKH